MAITKVTSSVLSSGSATDGYVLTADGSGNSAWEAAAGGIAGIVSSADATAITIDSSENVGIGTSNPAKKLEVAVTGVNQASTVRIQGTDGNGTGHPLDLKMDGASDSFSILIGQGGGGTPDVVLFNGNRNGNVGIGTSSPTSYDNNAAGISANLVVADSGHSGIIVISGTSSDAAISFGDGTGAAAYRGAIAYVNSQDALYFKSAGSNRMVIDSSGRVGIGTTNPEQVLHVYQAGDGKRPVRFTTGNNHNLDFYNDTDGWQLISEKGINVRSQSGGELRFTTGSGSDSSENRRMTIDTSGNIGAPTGTNIYNASDVRVKQNISTLSNSLDVINALNPVQFNWIDNFEESENGKNLYGFVAQEVQDVFPDAVESFGTGNDIEVDGTVIENPLTVRDKFFIPVLVKAMQEQQTIIESLKARITALES